MASILPKEEFTLSLKSLLLHRYPFMAKAKYSETKVNVFPEPAEALYNIRFFLLLSFIQIIADLFDSCFSIAIFAIFIDIFVLRTIGFY